MYSLAIEPRLAVSTNTRIYPPVVVRSRTLSATEGDDVVFAQAVLLSREGRVVENQLCGNLSTTGFQFSERTGSPTALAFVFSDLSIPGAGIYSIRIDFYRIGSGDPQEGAVLIEQLQTKAFTAYDFEFEERGPSTISPYSIHIGRKEINPHY